MWATVFPLSQVTVEIRRVSPLPTDCHSLFLTVFLMEIKSRPSARLKNEAIKMKIYEYKELEKK